MLQDCTACVHPQDLDWFGSAAAAAVIVTSAGVAAAKPKEQAEIYETKDSYTAAYHYITCDAASIVTPTSTAEVAAIVKQAYKKTQSGRPVTLRVSRPKFHSSATFVCPVSPGYGPTAKISQESGKKVELTPETIGVLQSKLNKVLAVDSKKYTMRVGPGMKINELLPAATKAKMSVQVSRPPVVMWTEATGNQLVTTALWCNMTMLTCINVTALSWLSAECGAGRPSNGSACVWTGEVPSGC